MSVGRVLLGACLVPCGLTNLATSTGSSLHHISFYKINFIFDENHFTREPIYFSFNLSGKRFKSTTQTFDGLIESHD